MRGRIALSASHLDTDRQPLIDPSSVGFADTFSPKGRRKVQE